MNIKSKEFLIKEGEKVDLKMSPALVKPAYKSKNKYKKLLKKQVKKLSGLQRLHYASDHYSVLQIFQALDEETICQQRYLSIVDLENYLYRNGTCIIKFLMHYPVTHAKRQQELLSIRQQLLKVFQEADA